LSATGKGTICNMGAEIGATTSTSVTTIACVAIWQLLVVKM